MVHPPPQSGSDTGSSTARRAEEEVYDRYADQVLDGHLVDPEEYLAEHHPTAGAKLREALGKLYRSARSGSSSGGAETLPFERLGEYELIRRLGRGGMGVVYEAEQTSLGRRVALKLVRPELWDSEVAVARFRREARTVAGLRHPNIVTVYAAGEENGIGYLAMELIEGASLAELLKAGELEDLPIASKLRWMADIARALHHAHEAGIVHRDVKPSNIRINQDGQAQLLDFGLVRSADAGATLTDSFAGTPSYASPEQVTGSHDVDARTDVYALGVTLYQCVTGRVPFRGASVQALFHEILTAVPTAPRKLTPSVPRDVEVATLHAMQRNPARRYQSAASFAEDLEAVLELRAIQARPPGPLERLRHLGRRHRAASAAALTAVLAVIAVGAATWWSSRAETRRDRRAASALVAAAASEIQAYTTSREQAAEITVQLRRIEADLEHNYVDPEQYQVLDRYAGQIADLTRSWDETYFNVLDLLRRAEALDPDVVERAHDVRVDLILQRYREVLASGSFKAAEPYRQLAREVLGERQMPAELLDYNDRFVVTDPPGAEVHLFKLVELSDLVEGGPPRLVPVAAAPRAEPLPVSHDRWCLQIDRAEGALLPGDAVVEVAGQPIEGSVFVVTADPPLLPFDRLVAVDGQPVRDMGDAEDVAQEGDERSFVFQRGPERLTLTGRGIQDWRARLAAPWDLVADPTRAVVSARVVRERRLIDVDLPPGLPNKPNAAAMYFSANTSVCTTPTAFLLQRGAWYVAVLKLPGREPLSIHLNAEGAQHRDSFPLVPLGTAPEGFVRLSSWAMPRQLSWIGEREVTCAEYLQFLNQEATLQAIEAADEPILYPRMSGIGAGPFWLRDEEGEFQLPDHWALDWPVIGVSWHDAVAYCAWRTQQAAAQGLPHRYSLPTLQSRYEAAGPETFFPFGNHFRPRWVRSCFAYPRARPGRTMQFPIDRSVHGVYDLSGNALEWLQDWWDDNETGRFLAGGAWGQGTQEVFKNGGGMSGSMKATSGETGFRLRFELLEGD